MTGFVRGMTSQPANRSPHRLITECVFGTDVVVHAFANLYGCTVGADTRIGTFVEVQRGALIGSRCKIGSHSFICEGVTLDDEVFIGHGVVFINDLRPRATTCDGRPQEPGDWTLAPTHVGTRASIGSGAVILGGISIGEDALIGAGAVVVADVAPATTVAGVPARTLRAPP